MLSLLHVQSLADFETHIRLHVMRVQKLGLELFRAFPEQCRGLSATHVQEHLLLHDRSKLWTAGDDPQAMLKRLFKFYGRDLTQTSLSEQKTARLWIDEVNAQDQALTWAFLAKHQLCNGNELSPEGAALMWIERVADWVDRSCDPVAREEFNRPMVPASKLFESRQDSECALYLEERYALITRRLDYSSFNTGVRPNTSPS